MNRIEKESDCILSTCPSPDLCAQVSACDAELLRQEPRPNSSDYDRGRNDELRDLIVWLRTEEAMRLARVNALVSHIQRGAHRNSTNKETGV